MIARNWCWTLPWRSRDVLYKYVNNFWKMSRPQMQTKFVIIEHQRYQLSSFRHKSTFSSIIFSILDFNSFHEDKDFKNIVAHHFKDILAIYLMVLSEFLRYHEIKIYICLLFRLWFEMLFSGHYLALCIDSLGPHYDGRSVAKLV